MLEVAVQMCCTSVAHFVALTRFSASAHELRVRAFSPRSQRVHYQNSSCSLVVYSRERKVVESIVCLLLRNPWWWPELLAQQLTGRCARKKIITTRRQAKLGTYPRGSSDAQVFHDLLERRRLLRLLLVVQRNLLAEFSRIVWGRHLPFFSKTDLCARRARGAVVSSPSGGFWALKSVARQTCQKCRQSVGSSSTEWSRIKQ